MILECHGRKNHTCCSSVVRSQRGLVDVIGSISHHEPDCMHAVTLSTARYDAPQEHSMHSSLLASTNECMHGWCNLLIVSIPDTARSLRQQHQLLQAIALHNSSQICVFQVTLSKCEHELCLDCFSTLCQQQSKPPLCPLCRGSITAIKAAATA